jgi:hypothetical protein
MLKEMHDSRAGAVISPEAEAQSSTSVAEGNRRLATGLLSSDPSNPENRGRSILRGDANFIPPAICGVIPVELVKPTSIWE